MKTANVDRVKRRMLQAAVAENLEVIQGLPPRPLRAARRLGRVWLRRLAFVVIPLSVAGSSYMISNAGEHDAAPVRKRAVIASTAPAAVNIAPAAEASMSAERMTASAFPLAVRRVVLDAGHGGSDPGALAADLEEKQITLDIGSRLRTLLERNGFDVVVTRDADRTIALKERARVANDSKSDIFVSIHVNAIVKHTESRGIETYYLGATNDPSLTALAAAENKVSGYSVSDMRKLLEGVYADARSGESLGLATAVQKSLYGSLRTHDAGLENWGVKRAPFLVLVATDMPAVLAEVGCISNDRESQMLRRPEYRQQIAEALFEGIRSYAGASDAPQKKGTEQNG